MVQLINDLDFFPFVLRYGYVLRLRINQTKEKIAPQHLLTAFVSNFKGRNNSFFFYEDDEVIH